MKHICETMRGYIDALRAGMQGDTIFCSEELWKQIMQSQPERSKREDMEGPSHIPDKGWPEKNAGFP